MLPPDPLEVMLQMLTGTNRWGTPGQLAHALDPRIRQTPALDLVDQAVMETLNTPDGRLILSMAPQEGKSQRVGIVTPIWQLLRDKNTRVAIGCYGQSLANRNGRAIRNLIITHPELGIRIAPDNGSAHEWQLAGADGGVLSVGRGAGINGRAVDLLIIDDPIKDRIEADSGTIRQTCWDWWTDALSTRLGPGAPVILIMTRWHEDDLAGRLLAAEDGHLWRVVNIPAQAESDDDPLGRKPGEWLQSARGNRRWDAIKTRVGARTWNALYQGRPSPAEGGMVKRDWWQRYQVPLWEQQGDVCHITCDELVISADLTFKGTESSDFVAIGVWARRGTDAYLVDQVRGRMDFISTLREFERLAKRWPQATLKLVEDKANGPALISMLAKRIVGIVPINPTRSKTQRLLAVAPLIESGHVYLPTKELCPWIDDYIEEHAAFPNGAHDDQVDETTMALDRLLLRPFDTSIHTLGDEDWDDYRIGY